MNERTVILENVANQLVGLVDFQGRVYRFQPAQRIRVSKATLQDILDAPGNRKMFGRGLVKIKGISEQELYGLGLTEDEIGKFAVIEGESLEVAPTVVVTDVAPVETEIIETAIIPEPIIETVEEAVEAVEVVKEEEPVLEVKATKTTTPKNSSKKSKK